jgi:hypothetical protein
VDSRDPEEAAQRAAWQRDAALRASAPAWRRARGVVHTPREVAAFMAERAWGAVLRHCPGRELVVVDPACGTGVFGAAWLAASERDAARRGRTRRLFGFDVDARALEAAHAVLEAPARAAGVPLELRTVDTLASLAPLGEPSVAGAALVVLGNPPWAGRGAGRGGVLSEALLDDVREAVRGERKIGVLSDDYVRFLRWGAEVVRRADAGGVLALVTNGSFLDGPIHRGLRGALLRWFDALDVVDLGGSALVAREAGRDENVFGVRPAAAITVASRAPGVTEPRAGALAYARIAGSVTEKCARLAVDDVRGVAHAPSGPAWRFPVVAATRGADAYARWPSLAELFPFHREGVQTNRDAAVVDVSAEALHDRLRRFAAGARDADLAPLWRASSHYAPEAGRAKLVAAFARGDTVIAPLAYRPFDVRWHVRLAPLCHRPRPELGRALTHGGLALVAARKDRGAQPFAHVGVVADVPDNCWLSVRSSCRARAFPTHGPEGAPNVSVVSWEHALGVSIDGAALVHYALAVLTAPAFRARFDVVLREDYPRLPPPPDVDALHAIVAAGARLAALQLRSNDAGRDELVVQRVGHHDVRAPRALVDVIAGLDALVAPLLPR